MDPQSWLPANFNVYQLAAALVLVYTAKTLHYAYNGPLSHLPGPWYTRFTGLVLMYQFFRANRAPYVHQLHQEYGPVVRLTPKEADLCDVSAKAQIYTVKETFLKADIPYARLRIFTGVNVFNTQDVNLHRRYRRLLSGPLSESALKSVEGTVRERVDFAIQRMREQGETRGVIDVFQWWMFMTTDVIGQLTFGESFRTLEKAQPSEYTRDVQSIGQTSGLFVVFPLLGKWARNYGMTIPTPLPRLNYAGKVSRRMDVYGRESLKRYRDLVDVDPDNAPPTLFTKLFKAAEEKEDGGENALTFGEIANSARAYITAGSDTTSNTLTFLIWAVCKRPHVRDRLVTELQKLLPAEDDDITDEGLQKVPYLCAVIEEALRLFSVAPMGLPRVVPAHGAELAGYHFPAGVTVATQAYSLHRDPSTFPDPDSFNPERWLEPNVTKKMKEAFLAFGGGSRICIGLHLARMELRLATALFFRTFPRARVSTAEGMSDDDMKMLIYFLVIPKGKRCLIDPSF